SMRRSPTSTLFPYTTLFRSFLGLVSYEALSVQEHMDESIQQASIPYDPVHLYDTQHIYDAALFFQIHRLDLLPVVDEEHSYLGRSEEHTSELQSRENLVCRL